MKPTDEYKNLPAYKLWLLAIRPKTLPAAGGPIAVGIGSACATAGWQKSMLLPAIACFVASMLLQIGVNLANDYFDFKNEIDSDKRQGPVRVTQSGLISPEQVRFGMILSLCCAAAVFCYLTMVGGWVIAATGVFSLLAALAYSGGPWPLASHGLGELFVFIFFGLIGVGATHYILLGSVNWLAFWAAFPPGLLITAIMVVNNLRDVDTDSKAGKITLAVRLGKYRTILFYKALVYATYCIPLLFVAMRWSSSFVLLPLATFWLGRGLCIKVECDMGFTLNELLASTAKLSLLFSLMFAVGLAYHF